MRVERRVERRAEPGYWYTAAVVGPEGEYAARVYGDRLRSADLVTPVGTHLRLVRYRRGHRLIGPDGVVAASFAARGRRGWRMEAAGSRVDVRRRAEGYEVVLAGQVVGSVTARLRQSPAIDCFDAHGRLLVPILDWVLTVESDQVPAAAWAGLLVVLDDRRPTIVGS